MSRSDTGRHWLFVIKNVLSFKRNLTEFFKNSNTADLNVADVVDIESCHSPLFRLDGCHPEGKIISKHETGVWGSRHIL